MDEIIIEEKRYISSKQAAKITGYAKDYIGQLCREGRVPARLVGRSWYVLEAAIQDHRFGAPAVEAEEKSTEKAIETPLSDNLEKPKYSEVREEMIPSVNQLSYAPKIQAEAASEGADPVEPLEDSWRAWFERVEEAAVEAVTPHAAVAVAPEPVAFEEPVEAENEAEEVNVPVRAIHHSLYKPEEDMPLPSVAKNHAYQEEAFEEEPVRHEKKGRNYLVSGIQAGSIVVGMIAIILALVGSGYFDSYVLSNKQVSLVAGVSFYNK